MNDIKGQIIKLLKEKKRTERQLRKILHVKGEDDCASFSNALKDLEENGQIYYDESDHYQIFSARNLHKIQGKISIDKYGTGYIILKKGQNEEKYIVSEKNLGGALDGDVVVLTDIEKSGKLRFKGRVEKIIKRDSGFAIFEYDGKEFIPYGLKNNITFLCPKSTLTGIVAGHRVLVRLEKDLHAIINGKLIYDGKLQKILGHKDDPDIDIKAIAARHGFMPEFSDKALKELEKIPSCVTSEEIKGREDLRDKTIFTIDGIDTKDMDDAISIEKDNDGNYILSVHIADVTHYVKENMALYSEAMERGTSAYLANSVVPMLPHQLSNGICSLNEKVDRLTKTVEMKINKNGKIIDSKIYDSVIRSRKKMNYDDVNLIIDKNQTVEGYEEFESDLKLMYELSKILSENSKQRGNIDFYSDELKVEVDENGNPLDFKQRYQGPAEKLIENFMIAANETVTKYYSYMEGPFVYRIHAIPDPDKIVEILKTLKEEELCDSVIADRLINKIKNKGYTSKDIKDFLESHKNTENYTIISNQLLRGMSKAIYSHQNEGHYGLSLTHYTHFTSPIRRFPDLEVHNLINHYKTYEGLDKLEKELPEICEHSSFMEREADTAERETMELKMAQFMSEHINETFEGKITRITPSKMEIKLDNHIRGIVANDDIIRKPNKNGEKPKYKLGGRVYALVKAVSIPDRTIYLVVSKEKFKEETEENNIEEEKTVKTKTLKLRK